MTTPSAPMSSARLMSPAVQLGDAHQGDRFAAHGRADVFRDLFPVEVPVLGVDDDPVEAEGDGDLGDRGRFERDPQPERGPVGGERASKGPAGSGLHGVRVGVPPLGGARPKTA